MSTTLWLTPFAAARLFDLLRENTEMSALLVTDKDDPQLVIDAKLPPQRCSPGSTDFIDEELPPFLDELRKEGLEYGQLRIWFHTHPSGLASPSGKDNTTFAEIFGQSDWSMMVILTKDYKWYARVQTGGAIFPMQTEVEVRVGFHGVDFEGVNAAVRERWRKEAKDAVRPFPVITSTHPGYLPPAGSWPPYNSAIYDNVVSREYPRDPDIFVVLNYKDGGKRIIKRGGISEYIFPPDKTGKEDAASGESGKTEGGTPAPVGLTHSADRDGLVRAADHESGYDDDDLSLYDMMA